MAGSFNNVIIRLICLGCLLLTGASEVLAGRIVILTTDSLTATRRTVSGAKKVIRSEHPEAVLTQYCLSPNRQVHAEQIERIKVENPDVILTVGSAATKMAQNDLGETPIVFSAVLYPAISGFVKSLSRPGKNTTGASLNIPPDVQFRNFQKIVPNLKTIGVLYTKNTAPLIPPSRVVAGKMGMRLVAIEVNHERELPGALDSLAKVCDGIWSVADPTLFSPQSTKFILLRTIRRGIPFMGFSHHVVESGALFALDFDYKAVGRQAGHMVNRILDGANPGNIAVTSPDIIWFHYNEKTANHINVVIPDEMVAVAKEVYR